MSEENIELLHRAFDAFNRRDLVEFLALCEGDIEFISILMQVEGGAPYRGHGGVRTWWERLLGAFSDLKVEVDEVRDLGDLTIARVRARGHGVESDAPMQQTLWQAARWRTGRVVWWRFVGSEAEALEAAGLSE
jgi:ketosteroid isomerase-like protein